ncbi:MAG: SagB/ThcOx family dehydrogenase [Deltaproteobacteria bacterium]|nr:SagB/ThcOx family dehydrogenase [Deltaproteobacteria bacterium]
MHTRKKSASCFDDCRFFLKDTIRQRIDFYRTGQNLGEPAPPLQKPCPADSILTALPDGRECLKHLCRMSFADSVTRRVSMRSFSAAALSCEELSALLWASQGVREVISPECALRTVPSAGARHAFETYSAVNRVAGIDPGLYRYLPFDGKLALLFTDEEIGNRAAAACLGQGFVATAAATFFWTTIPARMEWRYDRAAHKVIAIDAGHVGQNIYLAATALGAGACAIAAYDQDACDRLLGVDGEEEFTIYIAAVGKRRQGNEP